MAVNLGDSDISPGKGTFAHDRTIDPQGPGDKGWKAGLAEARWGL